MRPRRKEGIDGYIVHDEMVLHDGKQDQVFALNVSARMVWEHCDGRATLDEISAALSREMAHPLDEVSAGVQAVVETLRQQGLLVVEEDAADAAPGPTPSPPFTVRIAFEDQQVVVVTDDSTTADWLRRLFRAMCNEMPGRVVGRLKVQHRDAWYTVTGTRDMHVRDGSLADTLRCLKYEVVLQLIEARPDLVWIHAGAAADAHGAVLLAGNWGCGKSTLVTELYRRGWSYLSDDVLPFDPATGRVLPFPLTPTVREAQRQHLPMERLAGSAKQWVDLAPGTLCTAPNPVQALIFPHYDPAAPACLEPYTPGTTVVELVRQCLNFEPYQGNVITPLCSLAERVPAYRLTYSRGQQAIDHILQAREMRRND